MAGRDVKNSLPWRNSRWVGRGSLDFAAISSCFLKSDFLSSIIEDAMKAAKQIENLAIQIIPKVFKKISYQKEDKEKVQG